LKNYFSILLISLLAIFVESLSFIGVFWTLIGFGESKLSIGISSIIPYIFQFFIKEVRNYFTNNIKTIMLLLSCFGAVFSFALFFDYISSNTFYIYVLICLYSLLFYLTNQVIEMLISFKVIDKEITEINASRILQVSLTVGSCLGGFCAGIIIDYFKLKGVSIIAFLGYFVLFILCLKHLENINYQKHESEKNSCLNYNIENLTNNNKKLWFSYIDISILAFATTSFNFLLPILVQSEKNWSATVFGIADSAAAIGAFLAILLTGFIFVKNNSQYFFTMLFTVCGLAICYLSNVFVLILISLLWGLLMNLLRIQKRSVFFELNQNSHEVTIWTSRLVVGRMMIEAISPILIGIFCFYLLPSQIFLGFSIFITLSLIITIFIKDNIIKKAKSIPKFKEI